MKISSHTDNDDCHFLHIQHLIPTLIREIKQLCLRQDGQSLIEACLAIFLISMIFTGVYQVSRIYIAKELLANAANRSARAEAVGFNHFMATKAARVAVIPSSGQLNNREFNGFDPVIDNAARRMNPGELLSFAIRTTPFSEQAEFEKARIPSYLESRDNWQAQHILDYSDWDNVTVHSSVTIANDTYNTTPIHMRVTQEFELRTPLHRAFSATDEINLEGESYIENHFQLYLEN